MNLHPSKGPVQPNQPSVIIVSIPSVMKLYCCKALLHISEESMQSCVWRTQYETGGMKMDAYEQGSSLIGYGKLAGIW